MLNMPDIMADLTQYKSQEGVIRINEYFMRGLM